MRGFFQITDQEMMTLGSLIVFHRESRLVSNPFIARKIAVNDDLALQMTVSLVTIVNMEKRA